MRDFPSTTFCTCAPSAWPVVVAFVGWGLPLAGLGLGLGYYDYSDPCVVLTGVAPAPAGPL